MQPDWVAIAERNSRSVQTTIGWIFWDPGAVERYERLGLTGPFGYIAARCAPLAPAGADAVIAAFGSISPAAIRYTFDQEPDFGAYWQARDEAVVDGLRTYAPEIEGPLVEMADVLWPVVDELPTAGRVLFAAHLGMPRPAEPLLSGWHAVNCVREWRGDTHWALVAAAGLSGVEASILHNAWLGYEEDWIARSRGSTPEEIAAAWRTLEEKGLAAGRTVTPTGMALRQQLEEQTDRLTADVWRRVGHERSMQFASALEPPCERLLARVDVTAGPNYQPASRLRQPRPSG